MEKRSISSPEAPLAVGGYAQALEVKDASRTLYVSGQIPASRDGVVPTTFREQCRLAWRNLEAQLFAADMTFDNLVKVTTFLSNHRFGAENGEVRREMLGDRSPALTVIVAGIFDDAWLLEIEAIAMALGNLAGGPAPMADASILSGAPNRPTILAGTSRGCRTIKLSGGRDMSTVSNHGAATITEHEGAQVARANATGLRPVVFVHGLWLLPSSWDRWAKMFEQAGFTALTPGWPDDPDNVEQANIHPSVFAHKSVGQVADHFDEIVRGLTIKPVVIGHSFGGLLAQILAGRGLAAATVAIDPAPFRGVLPLPFSALKSAWPVLGNPANINRAIPLTFDQFRFAFANAVSEHEAQGLYDTFAVPASGKPLFQAAAANLNPWTEAKVDTETPERGPLLIISGEKDNTVPWAIANASFKLQQRNAGVTEIIEMPNRGHSLTIDDGWREVAATALGFAKRFV